MRVLGSAARQAFQGHSLRVASLPEKTSQTEEALALTLAAHHEACQDAVHERPKQGLVAAAHLAGDDRWSQHLLGVIVGGRHLGIVEEYWPLATMGPNVVVQAVQFRADRPRQAVEPVVEAMLDLLDATGVAGGGELLPAGFVEALAEFAVLFFTLARRRFKSWLSRRRDWTSSVSRTTRRRRSRISRSRC
jgi:hypothetical protein